MSSPGSRSPTAPPAELRAPAEVVVVADRFPAREDPLAEFARTLGRARVEAAARPESPWPRVSQALRIDYREDDGIAARAAALLALFVRHPLRCVLDVLTRGSGEPTLSALAPAVLRLRRDGRRACMRSAARSSAPTARRLGRLAGRPLDEPRH